MKAAKFITWQPSFSYFIKHIGALPILCNDDMLVLFRIMNSHFAYQVTLHILPYLIRFVSFAK